MFVHLRLHTEFSVVDGTNRIEEIVQAAAADAQPAVGLTDLNNLFGAIKFYKEARGKGLKPVIGSEIMLQGVGPDPVAICRVVLLVQDHRGYLNLFEQQLTARYDEKGETRFGRHLRVATYEYRKQHGNDHV